MIDTGHDSDVGDALAAVARAPGTVVLQTSDPAGLALALVDELAAALVDEPSQLADAVAEAPARSGRSTVVCDLVDLADVGVRLRGAVRLLEVAEQAAIERARSASGVVLHPDAIRDAAADVLEARADLLEIEQRLAPVAVDPDLDDVEESRFQQFWTGDDLEPVAPEVDHAPGAPAEPARGDAHDADGKESAWPLWVSVVALVVEAALGLLVVLGGGEVIGLALAGIALLWVGLLWVRGGRRREPHEPEVAVSSADRLGALDQPEPAPVPAAPVAEPESEDLTVDPATDPGPEAASALAPAADVDPALTEARDRAERRLQVAEARWRALLGPGVSVEDLETELDNRAGGRTPALVAVADESASVRTARRHLRRLLAEWKVAFWALGQQPPTIEDADAALEELRASGRTEIVFVEQEPSIVVVLDEQGTWTDTTKTPTAAGVKVVVVGPA